MTAVHTIAVASGSEIKAVTVPTIRQGAAGASKWAFKIHDEVLRDRSTSYLNRYVVTHAPTGRYACSAFARLSDARAYARWAQAQAPEGGLFAFGFVTPENSPGLAALIAALADPPAIARLTNAEHTRLCEAANAARAAAGGGRVD